jgi:hypothetical protein
MHFPALGPDHPALQVHSVKAVLSAGELESAGQLMQSVDPAALFPSVLLYLPALHAVHDPPLGPHQPALQVQAAKAVLCAGELESAGHAKQVDKPVVSEYVPLSHRLQTASPTTFLYLPATHAVHGPPFGPVDPVLQVQLVKASLPGGELEFDGQTLQVAVPVNVLYFPATHAVHGPPFGPVDPVLQVQLVKPALPAGELEFDGQALHVELFAVPTAAEYVPTPQSVQVAAPVNVLYFPATHAVHGPPSGPENPALQVQAVTLPEGALTVSAVKSTPRTMRSAMADVASMLKYSSTTNTPATSPLR